MRSLAVLSSLFVVVALGVAPSAAAEGPGAGVADRRDTPGCVSKKEFRNTPKGTPKRIVHRRYDTNGRPGVGGGGGFTRTYPFCTRAHANTRRFTVIYDSSRRPIRVLRKYCGRDLDHLRRCFG